MSSDELALCFAVVLTQLMAVAAPTSAAGDEMLETLANRLDDASRKFGGNPALVLRGVATLLIKSEPRSM